MTDEDINFYSELSYLIGMMRGVMIGITERYPLTDHEKSVIQKIDDKIEKVFYNRKGK